MASPRQRLTAAFAKRLHYLTDFLDARRQRGITVQVHAEYIGEMTRALSAFYREPPRHDLFEAGCPHILLYLHLLTLALARDDVAQALYLVGILHDCLAVVETEIGSAARDVETVH